MKHRGKICHSKFWLLITGSTSTKIAVYVDSEKVFNANLKHTQKELAPFAKNYDQKDYRIKLIYNELSQHGIEISDIDVVIGCGGRKTYRRWHLYYK